MGRFVEVEEIAAAAVFLASDEASFINGHLLLVDGGWSANSSPTYPEIARPTHPAPPSEVHHG